MGVCIPVLPPNKYGPVLDKLLTSWTLSFSCKTRDFHVYFIGMFEDN